MNDIRKLPAQAQRVETGPVQFGEDWPGVFIRGDGAAWYAMMLGRVLGEIGKDADPMVWLALENLRETLAGAVIGPARALFERRPEPAAPAYPDPPPQWLPPSPATPTTECSRCGLQFTGTLGYVCPHPDCPSGLGGPLCANTCCAQDPVIGN